jgi:hypothetical protein
MIEIKMMIKITINVIKYSIKNTLTKNSQIYSV